MTHFDILCCPLWVLSFYGVASPSPSFSSFYYVNPVSKTCILFYIQIFMYLQIYTVYRDIWPCSTQFCFNSVEFSFEILLFTGGRHWWRRGGKNASVYRKIIDSISIPYLFWGFKKIFVPSFLWHISMSSHNSLSALKVVLQSGNCRFLADIYPIMMEKSALGGTRPPPFTISTITYKALSVSLQLRG
jgi:hypothetical protein